MNANYDMHTIQEMYAAEQVLWQTHCRIHMVERGISEHHIAEAIQTGEIIEEYPGDYPYPSCLIHGRSSGKNIHVVLAVSEETLFMITAYYPNTTTFEEDLKTRRHQ